MIFICEALFLSETKLDESDLAKGLWPFNTQTSAYSVFSAANRELIRDVGSSPFHRSLDNPMELCKATLVVNQKTTSNVRAGVF
jgi:hypothetical protein